jgi:hypothetical protein
MSVLTEDMEKNPDTKIFTIENSVFAYDDIDEYEAKEYIIVDKKTYNSIEFIEFIYKCLEKIGNINYIII